MLNDQYTDFSKVRQIKLSRLICSYRWSHWKTNANRVVTQWFSICPSAGGQGFEPRQVLPSKTCFRVRYILHDVPTVNWSRTYICQQVAQAQGRPAEGVGNHGQGRPKGPSPDCEFSATGNGERTGWKSLENSYRTIEPWLPASMKWSTRLVNTDKSTSK